MANGIIQGGDPLLKDPKTPKNLWGTGGLNLLAGEFSDLKHERGVVSTVRIPNKPDSDGSQFFVCVSPQAALDGQYSTFGRVTEGMDVVETHLARAGGRERLRRQAGPHRQGDAREEEGGALPQRHSGRDAQDGHPQDHARQSSRSKWSRTGRPNHVRNFLKLTSTGWYNGTVFHRVIPGFVVQGGMDEDRSSGRRPSGRPLGQAAEGRVPAATSSTTAASSPWRAPSDPDSATTSFFLMLGAAPHLDGQYSAFGRVIEGMEVLDAFEKEAVDGETPKRRLELIEAVIDPN